MIEEFAVEGSPYGIAAGADGAVWTTLIDSGRIARVSAAGEVALHDLGAPASGLAVIVPGPDGALWFTRSRDDRIGRVSVDGEISAYELPARLVP